MDGCQRRVIANAQRLAEGSRVGSVLLERAKGNRTDLWDRVGVKELRAAVHGVNWLARGGLAAVPVREGEVSRAKAVVVHRAHPL
jgi:hypothetical protein